MNAQVKASRLRLTQRLLIAASDADPGLLTDDHWMKALSLVTALVVKANPEKKIKAVKKAA